MNEPTPAPAARPLLRDAVLFQLKLVLGNVLNFFLAPVSLVLAVLDLIAPDRDRPRGARFYRVLELGRDLEERVGIYAAVGGYHGDAARQPTTIAGVDLGTATVDDLVGRIEALLASPAAADPDSGSGAGPAAKLRAELARLLDELRKRRNGGG